MHWAARPSVRPCSGPRESPPRGGGGGVVAERRAGTGVRRARRPARTSARPSAPTPHTPPRPPHIASSGSLTSRGMPLMPGLQHLGGKQTRAALRPNEGVRISVPLLHHYYIRVWASIRDESAVVAELSRQRNLWKQSRNCMPVGEFLNSKTMLTYTTKLNIAFKLTPPITPKLEHWPITSNTLG